MTRCVFICLSQVKMDEQIELVFGMEISFNQSCTTLPLPSHPPFLRYLPSPLEVGPLIELGGFGECCKIPQRGPGQSSGRPRISAHF